MPRLSVCSVNKSILKKYALIVKYDIVTKAGNCDIIIPAIFYRRDLFGF